MVQIGRALADHVRAVNNAPPTPMYSGPGMPHPQMSHVNLYTGQVDTIPAVGPRPDEAAAVNSIISGVGNALISPFVAFHEAWDPPLHPPPNSTFDDGGTIYVDDANGESRPWSEVDPKAAQAYYEQERRRAGFAPSLAVSLLGGGASVAERGAVGTAGSRLGPGAPRPPVSAAEADLIRNWLPIEPGQFRGTVRLDPPALSGELLDKSGTPIGSIDREIDPASKTAYHRDFQLSPANQGLGFSKDMMRSSVDFYRQQGLNKVNVLADDIGAYVWARHGFLPDQVSWDDLRRSLARRVGSFDAELPPGTRQDVLRLLLDPDPRAIWALSDLRVPALTASGEPVLTSLGQPMTLGQRLLLGQRWHGTLNLRDEATMRRFDDYARRR